MFGVSLVVEGILIVLALLVGLSFGSARRGCPILAIFGRWFFWLSGSLGIALLLHYFDVSSRPLWALALFCFLLWFLLETLYNWLAIDALSRSELPLFPDFRQNTRGNEWPAQPRFIQLREMLRKMGLKMTVSLIAEINGEPVMRCPVYESADALRRVQVLFLPHHSGAIQVSFAVSSQTEDGRRIVTDNFFLPFGGFYPEEMEVVRKPWIRSLKRLMRIHERRLQKLGAQLRPWEGDPAQDLNQQQREIERVNTNLGFLVPAHLRPERGKITREGRYRVWMELWTLKYLGIAKSY